MLVLVTYDVDTTSLAGQRRLRKVAKECQNYGQRVQNSVFECIVDYMQYTKLKLSLGQLIDTENDSIRFYRLGNNYEHKVETIGVTNEIDLAGDLIL